MKTIVQPLPKFNPEEIPVYHLPCRKHACQALLEISYDELQHEVLGRGHCFICPHCNDESMYDDFLLSTFKINPQTVIDLKK